MTTRERNYAYEALAEVTSSDMTANRGELNVALKSIREQSDVEDSYLLADEIHERAKFYRDVMGPDTMLTPTALAKHWKRVYEEHKRVRRGGANLSAEKYVPDDGKRGVGPPEWVWVWTWARKRGEGRSFPQQDNYADPTKMMSMDEYTKLRGEWVAAGSPREKSMVLSGVT